MLTQHRAEAQGQEQDPGPGESISLGSQIEKAKGTDAFRNNILKEV